jgi:hypothetical protein
MVNVEILIVYSSNVANALLNEEYKTDYNVTYFFFVPEMKKFKNTNLIIRYDYLIIKGFGYSADLSLYHMYHRLS